MKQHSAKLPVTFVLSAWICISLNDVVMKLLSNSYALHQIVFVRSIGGLFFTLLIIRFEDSWALLEIDNKLLLLSRCLLMVMANLFYFTALVVLPLADATALFFVAPIFISILSTIILKETIGRRRISAILIGLVGIIIVIRPFSNFTNNFQFATYFLPVVAALCYALAQVTARKLGATTKASLMAFYLHLTFILVSMVFGSIVGDGKYVNLSGNPSLVFLLRPWEWPSYGDWPLLIFLGALAGAVAYCITKAYVLADASFVAPFEYIAVPLATFWGWLIFKSLPDFWTGLGILTIIISGLYIYRREQVNLKSST